MKGLRSRREETSNGDFRNNKEVHNPPKKKSNWSAQKTNSPELEAYLTSVREIYSVMLNQVMSKITFLKKEKVLWKIGGKIIL